MSREMADVSWRRSLGGVFRIRLAPREIMACIDCVAAAGAALPAGTSLAQVTKRGIIIALNTLRDARTIPTRDGFEYLDMVAPYAGASKEAKIRVGHQYVVQDARDQAYDVEPPVIKQSKAVMVSPLEARLTRQKAELLLKQELDPLNFDSGEKRLLVQVTKELVRMQKEAA